MVRQPWSGLFLELLKGSPEIDISRACVVSRIDETSRRIYGGDDIKLRWKLLKHDSFFPSDGRQKAIKMFSHLIIKKSARLCCASGLV